MWSLAVILGFALMVLLPCAVALVSSRERRHTQDPAYADRTIHSTAGPVDTDSLEAMPDDPADGSEFAPGPFRATEWSGGLESETLVRMSSSPHGRAELAEIESLQAQAIAARAHSEALAAIARAAVAKAEAAASDADELEDTAARALDQVRRAA